jgi:RecB family endonuclease NucS
LKRLFGFKWAIEEVSVGRHITKGHGEYKTSVGFLDVSGSTTIGRDFCVEVKITPVGVGDIIQQIHMYREYWPEYGKHSSLWAAVTAFNLSDGAQDVLEGEGIVWAQLGAEFDSWTKRREMKKPKRPRRTI